MKPQAETNVAHPYLRNLTYHCLADNALQTITFDRVVFLNLHRKAISQDIRILASDCEKAVLAEINSGVIRARGARAFIEKLSPLEHFDSYSDAFLAESIASLKKNGITFFIDFCSSFNIDPFLAIAYQAVNFGRATKDLDIALLKDLSSQMDRNPALNKFFNHVVLITARETGLINQNECLILRSLQENLQVQNFEVHGLNTLMKNAVHVVKQLRNTPLRQKETLDAELVKLISGSSLLTFTSKLSVLRGYLDLQKPIKFGLKVNLNWSGEKSTSLDSRSGNRE